MIPRLTSPATRSFYQEVFGLPGIGAALWLLAVAFVVRELRERREGSPLCAQAGRRKPVPRSWVAEARVACSAGAQLFGIQSSSPAWISGPFRALTLMICCTTSQGSFDGSAAAATDHRVWPGRTTICVMPW